MIIGIPKETKNGETRIALTPTAIRSLLTKHKNIKILVESCAGENSGYTNNHYIKSGANISTAKQTWQEADLIVKVKEPQKNEIFLLDRHRKKKQTIFGFFHIEAGSKQLKNFVQNNNITAVAYENVIDDRGKGKFCIKCLLLRDRQQF